MSLSINASVSGIQATFNMLSTSANNVANINTDGFKKQRTLLTEGENGGVVIKIGKNTGTGPVHQSTSRDTIDTSNVDISQEIAGQISAKHLFSANIAALKVFDEMQKGLIDIMG